MVNTSNHNLKIKIVLILSFLFFLGAWLFWTEIVNKFNGYDTTPTNSNIQLSIERYINSQFGFSFNKPEGYNMGEFDEGEKHVILAQQNETKMSFQILITALEAQDAVITKDIILAEIPDMKIENEKEISIGNARGLIFESNNSLFGGASAEVWFAYKGNLYQISGYKETKSILEDIAKAWVFE